MHTGRSWTPCPLIQGWRLSSFLIFSPPRILSWPKFSDVALRCQWGWRLLRCRFVRITFYVIPPDADLLIENGAFRVVSPRTRRNTQVDVFFGSLAKAMGPHAIGVIMSGYDGDGTEGCKKIKEGGGMTFAQDLSAEVDGMPVSAQAAGCIDLVLPPDKIAMELQMFVRASTKRRR